MINYLNSLGKKSQDAFKNIIDNKTKNKVLDKFVFLIEKEKKLITKENNKDINLAIKRIFEKMNKIKKGWKNDNVARFVCCMTLFWPDGNSYSSKGIIKGKISNTKKGKNGFGYDPIFIPDGYNQTFGEMESKLKMSIDHRFKSYHKIKKFFI